MNLTEKEYAALLDKDFLLTKASALAKIDLLLAETRGRLKDTMRKISFPKPNSIQFRSGKISRGENYRGLPYLVLDYPAYFRQDNIFAYRTMFWWGNFFSATLHLQGDSLDHYRQNLVRNLDMLLGEEIFICVGETPWEYHYGLDNYERLSARHRGFIEKCAFLKISRKVDLGEWEDLPEFSSQYLVQLLKVLAIS